MITAFNYYVDVIKLLFYIVKGNHEEFHFVFYFYLDIIP